MKIYTRTGDRGETSLLGGTRVSKTDLRIEAYGTVDELNSYLGLVRDQLELDGSRQELLKIQEALFTIGSNLALEPGKEINIPVLTEADIQVLEDSIDQMDEKIAPMRNFILPGGHPVVSHIHISRTVCRRAERRVIMLGEENEPVKLILRYLNRLSDYLFVLARYVAHELGVEEIPWKPSK